MQDVNRLLLGDDFQRYIAVFKLCNCRFVVFIV